MKKRYLLMNFLAYPILIGGGFLSQIVPYRSANPDYEEPLVRHLIESMAMYYGLAFSNSSTVLWMGVGIFMAVTWIRCVVKYSGARLALANAGSFLFLVLPLILVLTGTMSL